MEFSTTGPEKKKKEMEINSKAGLIVDRTQFLLNAGYFTEAIIDRVLDMKCVRFIDEWTHAAVHEANNGGFASENPRSEQTKARFRAFVPVLEMFGANSSLDFTNCVEFTPESISNQNTCPNMFSDVTKEPFEATTLFTQIVTEIAQKDPNTRDQPEFTAVFEDIVVSDPEENNGNTVSTPNSVPSEQNSVEDDDESFKFDINSNKQDNLFAIFDQNKDEILSGQDDVKAGTEPETVIVGKTLYNLINNGGIRTRSSASLMETAVQKAEVVVVSTEKSCAPKQKKASNVRVKVEKKEPAVVSVTTNKVSKLQIKTKPKKQCPVCRSSNIWKNGGDDRYPCLKCKDCGKAFVGSTNIVCTSCSSERVQKNGKANNGAQQYKCRDCRKFFRV